MKTFDTVAKLKLAKLKTGQFVETGGYHTKGDAGGAKYLIVAPQAFDGYGDHELANGNVAVLQISESVNVKKFGALANGTQQEDVLQAAVDYLSGGGTIIIDSAYKCHGIKIVNSGITLDGVGFKGQLYREDSNPTWIVDVELDPSQQGRRFNIDGLYIVGNTINPIERGLILKNVYGDSEINCSFLGLQSCMQLGHVYGVKFT